MLVMKPNMNTHIALMDKNNNNGVQIELNTRHEWKALWNNKKKRWILVRDVFQLALSAEDIIKYFHPYIHDTE